MPSIAVDIQPEIIKWALKQTKEDRIDAALLNNIQHWLDGTKVPTFNQIEDFSKKACIPLGYFFLKTPPKENIKLIDYRTVDSVALIEPSRNLIDTISEMEAVQEWMETYRQDVGYEKCVFFGLTSNSNDSDSIARSIREYLEIPVQWYEKTDNARGSFSYWREKLNQAGVIVMMNGVVKNNTRRPLNTDEFRAFAMANEWAPLIFINAVDTDGARLFSLLHEATHIALGRNDLFNDRQNSISTVSSIETLCNAVAAELLVPNNCFLLAWEQSEKKENDLERFSELAKVFHVGITVIARRALDNNLIDGALYRKIANQVIDQYNQSKQEKTKNGGNFYNTMGNRLDKSVVRALCESIMLGRTSYTEAFRLTNTNKNTFPNVVYKVGGVNNW